MRNKYYVALVQSEGKTYLLLNDTSPFSIRGFATQREGLAYFERAYDLAPSEASACLHFIQFTPAIIGVPNLEFIKNKIINPKDLKPYSLFGEAGCLMVANTRAGAEKLWESGKIPVLV